MSMNLKKILVTGSSGFLGSALVKKLIEFGYCVTPFDIKIGKNVLDRKQLKTFLSDTDTVVHLASPSSSLMFRESPYKLVKIAIDGLKNILEQWNGHLIFPSTCTLYGNSTKPGI